MRKIIDFDYVGEKHCKMALFYEIKNFENSGANAALKKHNFLCLKELWGYNQLQLKVKIYYLLKYFFYPEKVLNSLIASFIMSNGLFNYNRIVSNSNFCI